jgi:hypothetical protein
MRCCLDKPPLGHDESWAAQGREAMPGTSDEGQAVLLGGEAEQDQVGEQ